MCKKPNTVDEALEYYLICASGWSSGPDYMGPDYAGFQDWIFESYERLRVLPPMPIHLTADVPDLVVFMQQLASAIEGAGIAVEPSGFKPVQGRFPIPNGSARSLKAFSKAKLLLSFLHAASGRELALLHRLTNIASDLPCPLTVTESASPFDHRAAFFVAVANHDSRRAFKMLGRLRECDHDRGELYFLEAFAEFQSGDLDAVIACATQVPSDAIDWCRARLLIIEAYALKGDVQAVEREISSNLAGSFPDFFLPYVWQSVVRNSDAPESALEKAVSSAKLWPSTSVLGSGVYSAWNQQSCELAVQFVEHRRDLSLRASALEQAGANQPDSEPDPPLTVRRVAAAVRLDPELYASIATFDAERSSAEIVTRLINHGRPNAKDCVQALLTQWRIGDRAIFVENVLRSMDGLLSDFHSGGVQLASLAYREAVIAGQEHVVAELRSRLPNLAEEPGTDVTGLLEKQASPMGKLALRAAYADLLAAERHDSAWRDAGMVSLGFFRVLELEINHRLIIPLLDGCSEVDNVAGLDRLRGGEQTRKVKKAIEFWDRAFSMNERAVNGRKGMELGIVEIFLEKLRDAAGCDSDIKAVFRDRLQYLLSGDGRQAFAGGDLSRLVNQEARERFRNSPAHTRYVGLPRAREAKDYVEDALSKLFSWTTVLASVKPTVH